MSITKQFNVSTKFKTHVKRALTLHLPSDLIFSMGAAIYEKSEKSKSFMEKEYHRKVLEVLMKNLKQIRSIEEQYHGR